MKPREFLSTCDRVQKSLPFKLGASALVVALAIAAFVTYMVISRPPAAVPGEPEPAASITPEAQQPDAETAKQIAEFKSSMQAAQKIMEEIALARRSPTNVAVGICVSAGVMLIVVWLGLALTYLGLLVLAVGVALPMSRVPSMKSYATLLVGVVSLAAAFTALIAGLRAILSDNPVSELLGTLTKPFTSAVGNTSSKILPLPTDSSVRGIATKTIIEALRMKVSLIFIVVLIFALAALPLLLDQSTPLRYRVQSFLQWGTGGSYWLIAMLTLLFGVGSVAFEQRDRQIWQTMTKPVSSAQFILGKWLGLIGLNAVLLAVCCTGVFLFTEYLREQPAEGERVREAVVAGEAPTEDRMVLESQVLQARKSVQPEIPFKITDESFLTQFVKPFIQREQIRDPEFGKDQATYDKVVADFYKQAIANTRGIPPGEGRRFTFKGLEAARGSGKLLTVRYRIDAGANAPDQFYKLTFVFGGHPLPPEEVGLGPTHTLMLFPEVIDEKGEVTMDIFNAAVVPQQNGSTMVKPNPETCQIPAGGLEITYSAGSFQMNFLRVAFVLWIKLAFLSMLAVTAATFLSFPVACLVALAVFFCAEGSGFLAASLEYYDAVDEHDNIAYWKIVIRSVGLFVSWMFKTYANLKPTTKLVDGQLLSWSSVVWGTTVLASWTLVLYGVAVSIFRKRELATYSGQ